jgi:hypothetical protein
VFVIGPEPYGYRVLAELVSEIASGDPREA